MRIAILGAGNMGQVHAAAYVRIPDVELFGMVGRKRRKTEKVARQFGARAFTDPNKVLNDDSIDAIDVCYPTFLHRKYVIAALQRGKHVFCETPIALTLDDAKAMVETAQSSGRILMVALVMRFVAEYKYIHDTVTSGKLGKPLSVYYYKIHPPHWLKDKPGCREHYAEPVIEIMNFQFDYLNWLFGLPNVVLAKGEKGKSRNFEHIFASLEYENFLGIVEASAKVPKDFTGTQSVQIICEKGVLETTTRFISEGLIESALMLYPKGERQKEIKVREYDPYEAECEYFVRCVQGNADAELLSPECAQDALRVSLATRDSLRQDKPVVIR